MNRKLMLIVFLLLTSVALQGQSVTADSIAIKKLIDRALDTADRDIQQAYRLLDEAKQKAKGSVKQKLYAEVLFEEGVLYFQNGKYQEAIQNFSKATPLYAETNDKIKESRCYAGIGLIYQYLGDYAKSLKTLFKGLPIAQASEDQSAIAAIYTNIGIAYMDLQDWDNALKYGKVAIRLDEILKDTSALANDYNNMGLLYQEQNQYRQSIAYFKKAVTMNRQSGKMLYAAGSISNMSNVYLDLGQLDSALYYKQLAYNEFAQHKQNDFSGYCYANAGLGSILVHTGKIKEAEKSLVQCEECKELLEDFSYAKNYHTFLYEYYKASGNKDKALYHMEQLNTVKDSLAVQSASFENQRIAIRYEFDQKAREDSLQYQLNLSKQEVVTASYKNRMYLLLVAVLVVAGVAVGIVRRVRTIQKKKRRQELEAMRNTIAGDLHDDIGSTLSSIQIISSMMANHNAETPKMQEAAGTIARLSDKVASGIREIVWSVNPANDNLQAIVRQLRKLATEVLDTTGIHFSFMEELDDPEAKLLPQVRKDLIMLFKEAINNARKYSGTTQIDIRVAQQKTCLQLTVKDYGCGFDAETIKRGNGLANMERRAADMHADLSIISENNRGTLIDLKIPLP